MSDQDNTQSDDDLDGTVTPEDLQVDKDAAEEPAFDEALDVENDEGGDAEAPSVTQLDAGEEIAARTADTEETSTDVFTKTFVVSGDITPTGAGGYDHDANKAGTVNEAIQRGLRPTSETVTVKSKKKVEGSNGETLGWALTYTVPVELASDATESIRVSSDGAEVPAEGDDSTV